MQRLAVLGLVSACGFRGPSGLLPPHDGGGDDDAAIPGEAAPGDTAVDVPSVQIDAAADARPADAAGPPFCNAADPTLRACFTFDNDTLDRSTYGYNAVSSGVAFTPMGQDQAAVVVSAGDTMLIPQAAHTALTVSALAIRLYVRPTTLPAASARMGLVDNDAYRLFVQPGGAIRCAIGASGAVADATTTGVIAMGAWNRVTCLYDGFTLGIYINGVLAGGTPALGTIPAVTTQTALGQNEPSGENLDGAMDDLQIFGTTLVSP